MTHKWYTRPVFFVSDMPRAQRFYVEALGFAKRWDHEDGGRSIVCEVERGGCEIILSLEAPRADKGRVFVSLDKDTMAAWRAELAARAIPHRDGHWGYRLICIDDPDGNELFFPLEGEGNDDA